MKSILTLLSLALAVFASLAALAAPTTSATRASTGPQVRPALRPASAQPEARGGRVLRIPGFDLSRPDAQWHDDGRPGWTFVVDLDGRPGYRAALADRRYAPFTDWSTSARHTLPLKPNRSYVLSLLLRANFPRPAEVNAGFKFIDHAGVQVIWALNGLPNRTDGWQRWEWEFTTDPRTAHGVFAMLLIELPLNGSELAVGDVAVVELPERPLEPFAVSSGADFRGGPGGLPMKVEGHRLDGPRLIVETTGARYVFDRAASAIECVQRLEKEQPVARWQSSLPLAGLTVARQTDRDCLLTNAHLTIGIQCDSLAMIVPHAELALTLTSAIAGRWNRLAEGHLLCVDDLGGHAANPVIPAGSGRLARVHIGRPWEGIEPGRAKPGDVDFANSANDQTTLSQAKSGWQITWHLSPGERLAVSVFPPRPYPWKDSFEFSWLLAHMKDPLDAYAQRRRGPQHVELLWDFFQRGWAMSWGPRHEPANDALLRAHIQAIHEAGCRAIAYASPHWYYSRDPEEFAAELRRLRDTYRLDGIYYDGIPSQEWLVAYEIMRLTRELFPNGPVIVHNTGQAYNGNPPLGEPALRIPAVETYATATLAGELVYGAGADWPFLRYSASQYRLANCIGSIKGDAWEGLTDLQKPLAMLRVNGRSQYRLYPREYFEVLDRLRRLWEAHGHEPDFFEKHYQPMAREWTAPFLNKPGDE